MNQKLQYILQDQINIPMLLIEKHAALGITESQLAIILQIHVTQQKGNFFPTPEEISEHLTISSEECSSLLRQLIQRDLLSLEEDKGDEMIKESYSLERLWLKLYSEKESDVKDEQHMGEVFQKFEREFGRPLSPFEIEMINNWLDEDQHDTSMIYAALREAVLMGKVNFKYIDRILMEWQRKGVKSVQQAQQTSKAFHHNRQTVSAENKKDHPYDKSLYYNWLEE
ncbi:DnaD domain-containing protein [Gracilibacillus kekensis]|uniref:DNA replication protein DnaD n=1 Tax=Gracilibacillus kekensis TaxID=1027249 RepID=A0A1M7PPU6_9BACI|nr:DnaD domain-containing protein [Gracilibacillus kekensis]SHN19195.1 DNA replication protein DnaD [Gracilibacillus kekensis]